MHQVRFVALLALTVFGLSSASNAQTPQVPGKTFPIAQAPSKWLPYPPAPGKMMPSGGNWYFRKNSAGHIEGVWGCVSLEINGKQAPNEEARRIIVVYRSDSSWTFHSRDGTVVNGTSRIDPTKNPMTIDFTPTEGDYKDKLFLGIYETGDTTLKLCFAQSGMDRPTEFSSIPGSGHILVSFVRANSSPTR
jgi:uncharacterized protein (TIGR03067 family)